MVCASMPGPLSTTSRQAYRPGPASPLMRMSSNWVCVSVSTRVLQKLTQLSRPERLRPGRAGRGRARWHVITAGRPVIDRRHLEPRTPGVEDYALTEEALRLVLERPIHVRQGAVEVTADAQSHSLHADPRCCLLCPFES